MRVCTLVLFCVVCVLFFVPTHTHTHTHTLTNKNIKNEEKNMFLIFKSFNFQFFHVTPLNFHHLIAEIASPGPVVSVPTLGSWKYDDLL